MKTALLQIKLHYSRIGVMLLLGINSSLFSLIILNKNYIYSSNYISCLVILIISFINFQAFKYLSYSKIKQIDILTNDNKIILRKNSHLITAKLIEVKQISFWLNILYLKTAKHTIILPIFIDSTYISQYKKLKIFLLSYKTFK